MAELMRVDVVDNAGPWLQWVLDTHSEWQRKAIKSTSWFAQQEIKKGIRSGAPGGRKYAERISAAKRNRLDGSRKGRKAVLGKLVNAVGYQVKGQEAKIGWLSASAVRLGTWLEKGVSQRTTARMRLLYFAAGIGMRSDTDSITVPARPTFDPMFAYLSPKLGPYFLGKIEEYLANGGPPTKQIGKGRSYNVLG